MFVNLAGSLFQSGITLGLDIKLVKISYAPAEIFL